MNSFSFQPRGVRGAFFTYGRPKKKERYKYIVLLRNTMIIKAPKKAGIGLCTPSGDVYSIA